jgi:hypothetical protein
MIRLRARSNFALRNLAAAIEGIIVDSLFSAAGP